MRRTAIIAAVASLALLPACTEETEPSPMPTSEDALTTATEEPEDEAVTSEPEETTEEPTTEEPDAEGPPEMPAEAEEQTEEGAIAFATHYLELINYTGRYPEVGVLEPLAAESCESCRNHEESVSYSVENEEYLKEDTWELGDPETIFTGDGARVAVPVQQPEQSYYKDGEALAETLPEDSATLVVRVIWQDEWLIETITVDEQ